MTRPAAAPPDARAVARIAIVWRAIAHALIDAQVTRKMYEALRRRDVNGALAALPNFNDKNDPHAQAVAQKLTAITVAELRNVFKMVADREYRRVGSGVRVAKADPPLNRFAEVPHDDEFIFNRAAELVVNIGDEQRDNLRNVLSMRFDPDVRPENIIRDIKWVVGLTDRESAAVFRREETMRESGANEERIQRETQRYSDNLHQLRAERIARTETVGIETQARDAAWGVAQSDGLIDKDAQKEWVASHKACPDLCRKLDGIAVPVNGGHWISPLDGKIIKGPPAHPHCECLTVLR